MLKWWKWYLAVFVLLVVAEKFRGKPESQVAQLHATCLKQGAAMQELVADKLDGFCQCSAEETVAARRLHQGKELPEERKATIAFTCEMKVKQRG